MINEKEELTKKRRKIKLWKQQKKKLKFEALRIFILFLLLFAWAANREGKKGARSMRNWSLLIISSNTTSKKTLVSCCGMIVDVVCSFCVMMIWWIRIGMLYEVKLLICIKICETSLIILNNIPKISKKCPKMSEDILKKSITKFEILRTINQTDKKAS